MEGRLNRRRILVVDDDRSVCTAIKIILEDAYDVVVATSGTKALNCLANGTYDLIVLDVNMPGISGMETLEVIREKYPDTFVVMLSSDASGENMRKAASLGAYGFISKPFELDSIRNYIDTSFNIKKHSVHEKGPVAPKQSFCNRM